MDPNNAMAPKPCDTSCFLQGTINGMGMAENESVRSEEWEGVREVKYYKAVATIEVNL